MNWQGYRVREVRDSHHHLKKMRLCPFLHPTVISLSQSAFSNRPNSLNSVNHRIHPLLGLIDRVPDMI